MMDEYTEYVRDWMWGDVEERVPKDRCWSEGEWLVREVIAEVEVKMMKEEGLKVMIF